MKNNPYSIKWNLMYNMNPNSKNHPLTVADMEFEMADEIKNALKNYIDQYAMVYSEPLPTYSEAVVNWFKKRHQVEFDKDTLVQTTGVVSALYTAIEILSEVGDGILIQTPVYSQFMHVIETTQRRIVDSPLVYKDNAYTIDFSDLDQKLATAKVMILCQPHNPVGRMYSKEELQKIYELTSKHGVKVVSDEIHADFTITKPFVSFRAVDKEAIICTAASKSFNLAALQTANIFIPKQYTRDKFKERNNKLGIHGPSILGLIATEAAYLHGASWLDDKLEIIKHNYQILVDTLSDASLKVLPLEGTYLAWIYHGKDEATFMETLKNHDLYVSPGSSYGDSRFFRVNLAAPTNVIINFSNNLLDVVKEFK